MTPQSEAFLTRAGESLQEARLIAALPLARAAARSAYFGAFHAAEALITDRTGKIAKTHSGVIAEFARLTKHLPQPDGDLRKILGRGYSYKELADYGTDPVREVSDRDAAEMIEAATRFVARVAELLATPPSADAP